MNQTVFVATENYQHLETLTNELLESSVGVEMAAVYGRAGRGKTTAARRIGVQNSQTVFIRFEEHMASPAALYREVAFRLDGNRAQRNTGSCIRVIKEALGRSRMLILVDEADRMSLKQLNALRDIHDTSQAPVVLVGEEGLRDNLHKERRLRSRLRMEFDFQPVSQVDITVFWQKALDQKIMREWAPRLLKHSGGDFRLVVRDALQGERVMKASGLKEMTREVVDAICGQA